MDDYCLNCLYQTPMVTTKVYADEERCLVCGTPNPHFEPGCRDEGDEA